MHNMHLIVLVSALLLGHYLVVSRYRGLLTADGLFVLSQWIMTTGALWFLDLNRPEAVTYAWVICLPMAIYVGTSIFLFAMAPDKPNGGNAVVPQGREGSAVLAALFVISLAITGLYFVAVGYNVLALGLQEMFSTRQASDYSELRLQTYSTDRYLFPGYVNQFKNILLPSCAVVIIHYVLSRRGAFRWPIVAALVVVCLLSLLGTGQRGAFIVFCIMLAVFLKVTAPKRAGRRILALSLVALPLILLVTMLLGRSQTKLDAAGGRSGTIEVLLEEFRKRIFYDNQFSGWAAFEYSVTRPTQWGAEWLQGVQGILPGNPGSSLAREVFEVLYGNQRGTAPISMWGSVYYNWGWWGIILVPVILAFVINRMVNRFQAIERPTALEGMGYAAASGVVGNWVVGGPEYLLNAGLIAALFLWWLGARARRQRDRAEALEASGAHAPADDTVTAEATLVDQRSPAGVGSAAHSSGNFRRT